MTLGNSNLREFYMAMTAYTVDWRIDFWNRLIEEMKVDLLGIMLWKSKQANITTETFRKINIFMVKVVINYLQVGNGFANFVLERLKPDRFIHRTLTMRLKQLDESNFVKMINILEFTIYRHLEMIAKIRVFLVSHS